jgi:hypothetical protein
MLRYYQRGRYLRQVRDYQRLYLSVSTRQPGAHAAGVSLLALLVQKVSVYLLYLYLSICTRQPRANMLPAPARILQY